MKYPRGDFKKEYYELWQMGLLIPIPPNASVYSVKFRKNHMDEYSRVTLKAISINDALERASYAITYGSNFRPEEVDLHAVYDVEENLLWIDEPYYNIIQKKNEFRGLERREFLKIFGATSAAILYGLQPTVAHAIIPFGFIKKNIVPPGEQFFTTSGNWTAPAGLTNVSVMCVGGGGGSYPGGAGGGGSALGPSAVTPGQSYSVVVGAGGTCCVNSTANIGGSSSFKEYVAGGGTVGPGGAKGLGGYNGGSGSPAGGGAAGFGGDGAAADGGWSSNGSAAAANSGAGGSGGCPNYPNVSYTGCGGGGGASLFGGSGGAGGNGWLSGTGGAGGTGYGGASGTNGANAPSANLGGAGGAYGGGAGFGNTGNVGGAGAVRIIWGTGRSFPNKAI